MMENKLQTSRQEVSNLSIVSIIRSSIKCNIRQYTMIIALLVIWLIFTIFTKGTFMTSRNLSNLFLQTATTAIIAIGMTLVLVAGHLDLSAGSVVAFIGSVAAVLQVNHKFDTLSAIAISLLLGVLVGLWHGYWVAYRGVPAFIVTLAGMLIFRGAVMGVTQGATLGPMNPSFKAIGQEYLPKLNANLPFNDTSALLAVLVIAAYIAFNLKQRKSRLKYGFDVPPMKFEILKMAGISVIIFVVFFIMIIYLGVPYSILLIMLLALLFTFIAKKSTFGRHLYAIGGNKEAARLSGINIRKTTMILFIVMGVMEAVAGIVFTARLNAATAAAGQNFELDAIAAAVIGGTSTMGGEGTIIGAIIGALVMASLDNGMSLLNLDVTYQFIIKGMILLLAVWVDIATRTKSA